MPLVQCNVGRWTEDVGFARRFSFVSCRYRSYRTFFSSLYMKNM